MNRSIKSRLKELEAANPGKTYRPIYQDWDNPELWHLEGPQEGAALPFALTVLALKGAIPIAVHYETAPLPREEGLA